MERIFWVRCPHCAGRFYVNHLEMRVALIDLFCPTCRARFPVTDSVITDEREKPTTAAG
jgi:uncharacterized protein YbaR (Trm112 family)